jgi:hypothetical protein
MAGDLKTFWQDPGMPQQTDLGGDTIVSSGSDPNVDLGEGGNPITPFWPAPPVPELSSQEESSNSVSGLPSLPNRYEPADQPPGPPDLTDRNPGTIDKQ